MEIDQATALELAMKTVLEKVPDLRGNLESLKRIIQNDGGGLMRQVLIKKLSTFEGRSVADLQEWLARRSAGIPDKMYTGPVGMHFTGSSFLLEENGKFWNLRKK